MTVYASIAKRIAWLGTEFGEQFARRQFGDVVVDGLPRTARGKNAGKHKASIEWLKVEKGGWVREGEENGHVESRVGKVIAARLVLTEWGSDKVKVLHLTGEAGRFN